MAVATPIRPRGIMSPEAFERLDDPAAELIDGKVRYRDVSVGSSRVGGNFVSDLGEVSHSKRSGVVCGSDLGFQIFDNPKLIRKADCSFFASHRVPDDDDGFATVPPDLLVEVVSKNDKADEVLAKVSLWLNAGVNVVWVAYPKTRQVHVYRRGGAASILGPEDTLEGEGPLEGFSKKVASFFER